MLKLRLAIVYSVACGFLVGCGEIPQKPAVPEKPKILPPRIPDTIGNHRAYFGIHTSTCLDRNGRSGAYVVSFYKQSPATKDGLNIGDQIVEFANKKIRNSGELTDAIKKFPPNDGAQISVIRKGKLSSFIVFSRGYVYPHNQPSEKDWMDDPDETFPCKAIGLRDAPRP
jgi:membrane-associated protease RseP (regulator of RpoE activity)